MKSLSEIAGAQARLFMICGVSFLSLSLSGCLYEEGNITTSRIQIEESVYHDDRAIADFDQAYADALAQHFYKSGSGDLNVKVTYDPHSRGNTAMRAGENAARVAKMLRSAGVRDVRAEILPIKNQGEESRVLFDFLAHTAHAPAGCDDIPGIKGDGLEYNPDYKLGCSSQTLLARQISRPADLNGRTLSPGQTTDGRAAANIVDVYRSGAPNEPLEGETASEK